MQQGVPQIGSAKPRRIATFNCPTYVIIQVVGAATLYVAETESALMQNLDSGVINALQLTQAGSPGGIYQFWWNGDLWAAGSIAFFPQFVIPGTTTGSALGEDSAPVFGIGAS